MNKEKKKIVKVVDIVPPKNFHQSEKKQIAVDHDQTADQEMVPLHTEEQKQAPELKNNKKERRDFVEFSFLESLQKEKRERMRQDSSLHDQQSLLADSVDDISCKKHPLKSIMIWAGVLVVCALAWYAATSILPKASLRVVLKKYPVLYTDSIVVDKSISDVSAGNKQIPGQLFSLKKTGTFLFTATGLKNVNSKAQGDIIIHNESWDKPQVLLATTRFQTPEGKIYRLKDRTVVPAITVQNGVIIPAKIKAVAIADIAGKEGNSEAIAKLTIPGFSGSDKANAFWVEMPNGAVGGMVGQTAYPTPEEIVKARESAKTQILDVAFTAIASTIPKELRFIKSNAQAVITREQVNPIADSTGKFSVSCDVELSVIAFNEAHVAELMRQLAIKVGTIKDDMIQKDKPIIRYGVPSIQIAKGTMSVPLDYKGTYQKNITAGDLIKGLLSKNDAQIKNYVLEIDGIEKVTASFWPFWVGRIPTNASRVSISFE